MARAKKKVRRHALKPEYVEVLQAREHNLSIPRLQIPKRELVVFTGVSGSGKSSLAFDTLYAEGQRRYVESLSAYARQFLGRLERPAVEHLRGLSPTIAIEQKSASSNPRSTVGTITEIHDYLRVLYARTGTQHCQVCGEEVESRSSEEVVRSIFQLPADSKLLVLAPLVAHRKGEFRDLFSQLSSRGFARVRVDGAIHRLDQPPVLDKKRKHDVELVIDRVSLRKNERQRITEAVELALQQSEGEVRIEDMERGEGWTFRTIDAMAKATEVDLDLPFEKLGKKKQRQVLYGLGGKKIRMEWGQQGTESHRSWSVKFGGVIPTLMRRYQDTSSERMREHYRRYFSVQPCEACEGKRLRPESLAVKLEGAGIAEVAAMTVAEAQAHFEQMQLSGNRAKIAEGVLREIQGRLGFLMNVGLDYLTLDRSGPTLSGGEAQRIRLASQLGSELSGVMYVLDEPSIGLHQRDNRRLIETLQRLRDLGNSVIVVEHDEETIRAADHVVDFGPGAGQLGGEVVFSGPPEALEKSRKSLTGQYLSGKKRIEVPSSRRKAQSQLRVKGAAMNNLRGIDLDFPVGALTAVTGVSGAGKSSLVNGILLPALGRKLHRGTDPVGAHEAIEGLDAFDKVIAIDQKPIGRTPRSNPATYTKAFDEIRAVFAQLPEARALGFNAGRFSFNVKGGRCEACKGDGVVKVEMHFLSDVYVPCEVCAARRYNTQTLGVKFKGYDIAEVLELSVDECRELFANQPKLKRILDTLAEVGLGYVKVGQPAPTLSGGEAQRIKRSRELGKRQTGRTLYVLDEPTTGLHFDDIKKLLGVLQRLVDGGNTVIVIEHNLDVVKCADWVVDLGPEGGAGGGTLVAKGTPEQLARSKGSYTGHYLKQIVGTRRVAEAEALSAR